MWSWKPRKTTLYGLLRLPLHITENYTLVNQMFS
jgi:hypothetical protein